MKVLFVMRHAGYVRNFESTLRMLCDRGHRVHLAFQGKVRVAQLDPDDIALQLCERYPTFSRGEAPRRGDGWGLLGAELRLGVDYLRYCRPEYRHAPKLRERARRDAPEAILARSERGLTGNAAGRMAMSAWLRLMNRAIPRDPAIDAFLRKVRPDVLAVTPLIEPGSPQSEYVRSARALGIRTALCVASWDNLTNKGLIHGPVDLVTVWNDAMKREAVELHGVSANRVVITGAAAFDHWFDWRTGVTREAFCARVGLPTDRPYVLYLCSSRFVAPQEAEFIRTWVQRIRQSPFAALRNAGILVRPHPQNSTQWQDVDLRGYGGVVVWPAAGAAPVDEASRTDYFDSMYHSAAVVGVNTTAQIESAILGRRVYTLLAPEFRDTQEGTLHFNHLREVNGGLVRAAADFDEHLAQLGEAVRAPAADDSQCRRFVEAFVRPYGIDVPATPRLVEALENLGRAASRPERQPVWAPMVRRRLAGRSAELERQSRAVAEGKAARRAAIKVREAKRQAQEAERRARVVEKARDDADRRAGRTETEYRQRLQRLEALVADFSELGEVDRRKFLRAAVDAIPSRSFIELYAAAKPRKLDYEHAEIYMRVKTDAEEYRLHACAKEPFTIDWIHRRIAAGDVLYDIGANVGAYSLVAAKKPGGGARVFSFEPSYTTIATLCANVILNDAARQVTPIPIALSSSTEMTVFSLGSLEPGSARHALGDAEPEDGPAVYQQPVMMFRLDDVVEWFGLPLPNHIKMDVDGGELAVLEGASRTLASPSLQTMLIEVPTSLSEGVTGVLGRLGLRLESKISVKNKAGEYAVWYGLFARDASVRLEADATDHAASVSR
jgi:FkbM family methyltransferase